MVLTAAISPVDREVTAIQSMKIWVISDTHCEHEGLEVPDVDGVIHCGDESNHGNAWMNEPEAKRYFDWYSALEIST